MAKANKRQGRDAEALAALERLARSSAEEAETPLEPPTEKTSEIPLAAPVSRPVRRGIAVSAARVPKWYRLAVPLMFAVGAALLIIGLWATGAMIYMHTTTPTTPDFVADYPFIRWDENLGEAGGYTDESRMMAAAMLVCLPVAGVIGGMIVVMRRQLRSAAGKR